MRPLWRLRSTCGAGGWWVVSWGGWGKPRMFGGGGGGRDALEGKAHQRRPQRRLGRQLEEVAEAVGASYCQLQMPLKLALAVRERVAGHRLGALEGVGGYLPLLPMHPWGGDGGIWMLRGDVCARLTSRQMMEHLDFGVSGAGECRLGCFWGFLAAYVFTVSVRILSPSVWAQFLGGNVPGFRGARATT